MADDVHEARVRWRRRALPDLRGIVLDLGAGTGVAADHLDPSATWIALEPARSERARLAALASARPRSRFLPARAEQIPLEDRSVDAVIASTVLCSVRDPRTTLAEVVRVLRPGGRLVFFEHVVAARGTWSRFVQRAYAPISRIIDGGCDPARDTEASIRSAGFASVDVRGFQAPSVLGTTLQHIEGEAVR